MNGYVFQRILNAISASRETGLADGGSRFDARRGRWDAAHTTGPTTCRFASGVGGAGSAAGAARATADGKKHQCGIQAAPRKQVPERLAALARPQPAR